MLLPSLGSNAFNDIVILSQCPPLVCKNICERIRYKRISFGAGGNYFDGKKYCGRCEVYLYHNGLFCPCCGMQLRLRPTPSSRECKEVLRKRRAIDKVGLRKLIIEKLSNLTRLFKLSIYLLKECKFYMVC